MRELKVLVNGKEYQVELGDLSTSPAQVTVNGKSYEVSIEDTFASAPAAAPAAKKPVAVASAPAAKPAAASAAPVAPGAGGEVRAPMPGKILEVLVKPGDKVTSGQPVCTLEAMKMKNAIRADKDAVIAAVAVNPGQKVAYNDILVTFA